MINATGIDIETAWEVSSRAKVRAVYCVISVREARAMLLDINGNWTENPFEARGFDKRADAFDVARSVRGLVIFCRRHECLPISGPLGGMRLGQSPTQIPTYNALPQNAGE